MGDSYSVRKDIPKSADAWIQGRNGMFQLLGIEFSYWENANIHQLVELNFYGRKDAPLNAGAGRIPAETIDALCDVWLTRRGVPHFGTYKNILEKLDVISQQGTRLLAEWLSKEATNTLTPEDLENYQEFMRITQAVIKDALTHL